MLFKVIKRMNQSQIQAHNTMIKNINLYIHNTNLDEIALDVFGSDATEDLINQIEELRTDFMTVWFSLDIKYQENFIKCAYQKYSKYKY
jgi:hypothetical protein